MPDKVFRKPRHVERFLGTLADDYEYLLMTPTTPDIPQARSYKEMPIDQFKLVGHYDDPYVEAFKALPLFKRLISRNFHRSYVGGYAGGTLPFRESARFQLDFLIKQGLEPSNVLLDLGCGCLRGGIHLIDYMEAGHYLGVDLSAEAIRLGIRRELGIDVFKARRPEFVVSNNFDFALLSQIPDVVFANSVFTHLPPGDIRTCLQKLRNFVGDHPTTLFATIREVEEKSDHVGQNHYLGGESAMTYTQQEMQEFGSETGWETDYIGAWGHPKNKIVEPFKHQMMFRFKT